MCVYLIVMDVCHKCTLVTCITKLFQLQLPRSTQVENLRISFEHFSLHIFFIFLVPPICFSPHFIPHTQIITVTAN